jgi:hypothetical protein
MFDFGQLQSKGIAFTICPAVIQSLACPHPRLSEAAVQAETLTDRRYNPRLDLRIPLQLHLKGMASTPEDICESTNISARGVFFVTDVPLAKNAQLELVLEMPEAITGKPPARLRILAQVTRVEPVGPSSPKRGVGVKFLCYEAA